ncbi:MAG: hypothetical protein ABL977_10080 [Candidatus Eisenbacteria bacterium]
MNFRRTLLLCFATLALVLVAGCSQKAADNAPATGASSDSLLASSPIEPQQGQLQPQTDFQPQTTPPAETPTPAPKSEAPKPKPKPAPPAAPTATLAQGTGLKISVGAALSSETATIGQEWQGTINEAVTVGNLAPFPAGSIVHGVVDGVKPAQKGDRAVLVLRVTSIEANGKTHSLSATADSIVAGSTRTRNVGAVAGGAAAGALIGKAVGGSGKGALIGGLIGGAAATGAVASSKGYQATVKEGAELVFHVDRDTKLKL